MGDNALAGSDVVLAESGADPTACRIAAMHKQLREQGFSGLRRSPRPASRCMLLLHARSGSPGVDAIVTALVLAASRRSVSAPSHDRTVPSATRSVRACGEQQVPRHARGRDPLSCSRVHSGQAWLRDPVCPRTAAGVSGGGTQIAAAQHRERPNDRRGSRGRVRRGADVRRLSFTLDQRRSSGDGTNR
jgi:hypothetical protein